MSKCACGCGKASHQYQQGDAVWWYDDPRKGYGAFNPVKADFVKYNTKLVTIAVYLRDGSTRTKHVPSANIDPRSE